MTLKVIILILLGVSSMSSTLVPVPESNEIWWFRNQVNVHVGKINFENCFHLAKEIRKNSNMRILNIIKWSISESEFQKMNNVFQANSVISKSKNAGVWKFVLMFLLR